MAAKVLNLEDYTDLLSATHPTVPHTEEENQRLLAIVDDLTEKKRTSPEEAALLEVLLALIQKFEDERYATRRTTPDAALREMMRARGLKPKDLYDVFGSKGSTSEVLRGKRGISKAAARSLAERFHVSADLFI